MPLPKNIPGEMNRDQLVRALRRLGFLIDTEGGKGSHIKAAWQENQKSVTIPGKLHKNALRYTLKAIEEYSGITWEDIREEL